MSVKLLTEHRLEFLSLKGGRRDLSESTLVKMLNCWKSHATAHLIFRQDEIGSSAWRRKLLLPRTKSIYISTAYSAVQTNRE